MRIVVDGIRLYVDVEGGEIVPDGAAMRRRPTVVALHGGPGADHSTLKPELSALAAVCQVIYLDYRGHGRSDDGPRDQWTIARLADDVVGLCDALDIERPVVYGQSLGAIVALTYATRHPHHPCGLMLVAATPLGYGLTIDRVVEAFRRVGGDKAAEVCRRDAEAPSAETHDEWMRYCLPYVSRRRSPQEVEERRGRMVQRPYSIHERLNAQSIRGWVDAGIHNGEIGEIPANALASIVLALTDGLMLHASVQPSAFRWANVRRALDVLLAGIERQSARDNQRATG